MDSTIHSPSFAEELTAAGITDWRFTWGQDGTLTFHPEISEGERTKVTETLAAHQPPSPEMLAAAEALVRLRGLAEGALLAALLETEALKPDPLQAVKDWAEARDAVDSG